MMNGSRHSDSTLDRLLVVARFITPTALLHRGFLRQIHFSRWFASPTLMAQASVSCSIDWAKYLVSLPGGKSQDNLYGVKFSMWNTRICLDSYLKHYQIEEKENPEDVQTQWPCCIQTFQHFDIPVVNLAPLCSDYNTAHTTESKAFLAVYKRTQRRIITLWHIFGFFV